MVFEETQEWIEAMKNHKCNNKNLIPCDNPEADIFTAKMEKRKPQIYPKAGYVCINCGEMFEIELRDVGINNVSKEITNLFKTGEGRKKLGFLLNDNK